MASLELRNKTYRLVFMYGGRRYSYSLHTDNPEVAEGLQGGVENTLMFLEQKVWTIPAGMSVVDFVRAGGRVTTAEPKPSPDLLTFAQLRDRYLEAHRRGSQETGSLKTMETHLKHLAKTLGESFPVGTLTLADLQRHVDRRQQERYRGSLILPQTARKEVTTFSSVWNWALPRGFVGGVFPSRGLVYGKQDEPPEFKSLAEVERLLAASQSEEEREALRECIYLTLEELDAFLAHVRDHAAHDWVYPMVCFVSHTGARRSEALRALVTDVDFERRNVTIREKKKDRRKRTTRRVPLTPALAEVLRGWVARHPGGKHLFCHEQVVARSKKRSATTGHISAEQRPKTQAGRRATVCPRGVAEPGGLTRDEAHDHFKRTLAESRWGIIPGWHCLRHSFISACASKGIDQRLIDEWVGHSTDEQRRRYRHLYPATQQAAIESVFG